MARYPTCVFCSRNDSEPSAEDVLAKWIAREWPGGRFMLTIQENDGRTSRTFGTKGHLGITTKKPCRRCNNEWMSDLETETKPIIQLLMRGHTMSISTDLQRILARWLVKTVIMYEYAKQRSPRFFQKQHRRAFFKDLFIPDDTLIYLARYVGSYSLWHRDGDFNLLLQVPGVTPSPCDAYTVTLVIGQLAFQLFSLRRPPDAYDRGIKFRMPNAWSRAHVRIWPLWERVRVPGRGGNSITRAA